MQDLLRNVAVIDGPLSAQMNRAPQAETEIGDNVLVVSFEGESGNDITIHLRRGMTREKVAEAFDVAAAAIRQS